MNMADILFTLYLLVVSACGCAAGSALCGANGDGGYALAGGC